MATSPFSYRLTAVLLSAVALTGGLACRNGEPPGIPERLSSPDENLLEWVLVYQMSYDNNLAWAGFPILEMLRADLTSDRVAVALFADLPDDDGMLRVVLTADGMEAVRLATDDSASASVFAQNMAWVGQNLPSRRVAVILLDHGGQLDEIGLDDNPGGASGPRWLSLSEVADHLRQWRVDHEAALELLFLQQCGKGSIESYLELRDTARFVMASEIDVDAPNGYYGPVLRALSATPDLDGQALAQFIMRNEPESMFGSFTLVDNSALDELPTRLDAALSPLVNQRDLVSPEELSTEQPLDILFNPAAEEEFVDLIAWLETLYNANGVHASPVQELSTWLSTVPLVDRRVTAPMNERLGHTSGFSVMLPADVEVLERYRSFAIYERTLLDDVHLRLLQ